MTKETSTPEEFKALPLLRSLDNFSDPVGPSAQLETERLMKEMRRLAKENPNTTFRLTEDGPEQTIVEIMAELDAESAFISALRTALDEDGDATQ